MTHGNDEELTNEPDARCVAGCYRCLLSYYNQPDHELIDRKNRDVQAMLLRLARCRLMAAASSEAPKTNGDWHAALAGWGLPTPDKEPLTIEGSASLPLAWRNHLAAAAIGSLDDTARARAEALGFAVAVLPESPGDAPPPELIELFG